MHLDIWRSGKNLIVFPNHFQSWLHPLLSLWHPVNYRWPPNLCFLPAELFQQVAMIINDKVKCALYVIKPN